MSSSVLCSSCFLGSVLLDSAVRDFWVGKAVFDDVSGVGTFREGEGEGHFCFSLVMVVGERFVDSDDRLKDRFSFVTFCA